ncbi:MAG: hypothetical protein HXX13_06920 [Bacteroidetes bacterium]|nr:hypothetical protein [Bacteroidota bacterium]
MKTFLLLIYCLFFTLISQAQEYEYFYNFFTNSPMQGNFYFSRTSSSGGSSVKNENNKLPVSETQFHTPGNALELQYINSAGGKWQSVIYHHDLRGVDHFKKTTFLSFWVMSPAAITPSEELPALQLMRKDSSLTAILKFQPGDPNEWKQVVIPLGTIKDLDYKTPGSCIAIVFSQNKGTDGKEHTLFVDDMEFISSNVANEPEISPEIMSAKGYAMHVDIAWEKITDRNVRMVKIYRSENGKNYIPVGIQQPYINRYADFTGETGKKYHYKISFLNMKYQETKLSSSVSVSTHTLSDEELLTMVQEASFRYYWEGAEAKSGLSKEDIPGRQNMIATGASGFGIMALLVGADREFVSRDEAATRLVKILNFLEKAETFHGAYPHFINGLNAKVEPFFGSLDNGADLVETSFLMEGLLAAKEYFSGITPKEQIIRKKITGLWEKVEWDWFRQNPDSKFLYWHWSPDQGWVINHNLIGWNETMVTYLLGIASPTHPIPPGMYYSGWANQDSVGQKYRIAWGGTTDGSMYTNGNTYYGYSLDVGVSNGGPLFFTHYSYMGYDPHAITDKYTNYFTNNQKIAKINYCYCLKNPKQFKGYNENSWGLSASDGPYDYSADEPIPARDCGKITPTAAISSYPYTPEESLKALKTFYFTYGKFLWGEYGFRDAFNLTDNWCSEIYMGLNQAPMAVMIENYRTGLIWNMFMINKDILNGLKKNLNGGK